MSKVVLVLGKGQECGFVATALDILHSHFLIVPSADQRSAVRRESGRRRRMQMARNLPQEFSGSRMGRSGFCFLRLHGKKIRVPNDRYSELKEATMARVAVLPNSLIAVRVDLSRGIGLS